MASGLCLVKHAYYGGAEMENAFKDGIPLFNRTGDDDQFDSNPDTLQEPMFITMSLVADATVINKNVSVIEVSSDGINWSNYYPKYFPNAKTQMYVAATTVEDIMIAKNTQNVVWVGRFGSNGALPITMVNSSGYTSFEGPTTYDGKCFAMGAVPSYFGEPDYSDVDGTYRKAFFVVGAGKKLYKYIAYNDGLFNGGGNQSLGYDAVRFFKRDGSLNVLASYRYECASYGGAFVQQTGTAATTLDGMPREGGIYFKFPTAASATFETSPDGLIWTKRTLPVNYILKYVAFNPLLNRWCMAGGGGTNSTGFVISDDLVTWTRVAQTARNTIGMWCLTRPRKPKR